jgi:hypothetical protein
MTRNSSERSMLTNDLQRQRGSLSRTNLIRAAMPLLRILAAAIFAIVLVTIIFPALVAAQAAAF